MDIDEARRFLYRPLPNSNNGCIRDVSQGNYAAERNHNLELAVKKRRKPASQPPYGTTAMPLAMMVLAEMGEQHETIAARFSDRR